MKIEEATTPAAASAATKKYSSMVVEAVEGDPREHLNLVFIGHVDAGKSTLSDNILLTDKVRSRSQGAQSRELVLGLHHGHQRRGTCQGQGGRGGEGDLRDGPSQVFDIGRAGLKNYVPNMFMGASQADVGVLVIWRENS